MRHWLFKSEPDSYSIQDLRRDGSTFWDGVRNYQARNFMRDAMSAGDGILFYHSSCAVPGVAGIAEVASSPYPDATQFDPASPYHDPKATPENPRWISVDVRALEKGRYLPLGEMRAVPALEDMVLDEPATVRALATYILRGVRCGAITAAEVMTDAGVDESTLAALAHPRRGGDD